ncbi:MAG: restriction endonuclease subunit S [Magnetococcus sp. WYHC-3]
MRQIEEVMAKSAGLASEGCIRMTGWKQEELGGLATFKSGGTPSKGNDSFWGGSFPWVTAKDMKSPRIGSSILSLTEEGKSHSKIAESGSLLVLVRGMTLRKDVPICLATRDLSFNQDIKALSVNEGVDSDFLLYGLQAKKHELLRLVDSAGHGTGRLDLELLKGLVVPLPASVDEQQKIAAILSTWDEAIEKLTKLIAAKRRRKQGLMQRLLTGRFKLAAFRSQPWRKRELGEFFTEHRTINKNGEELTILSCSKIYGIVPQSEVFGKRLASKDLGRYKIVGKGDLVYDPMLLWDASIGFSERVDRGVISPAYATFHYRSGKGDWRFFRHLFQTHYMKHQYKVISRGTNVRRRKAMPEDFLRVAVRMPNTTEEQRHIATILDDSDLQVRLLESQRNALQTQKRGLMQKLLTGQWRVEVTDE